MCWVHLTQLCHILPGLWFQTGKCPQKHPAEFYYLTKLKGNLYSLYQKGSDSPWQSISCYLVSGVYLRQLVPELQHLDSHRTLSTLFNSFSAKSIDCGQTTSLAGSNYL